MGNMATLREKSSIDELTDDALLRVFSYLSFAEKCQAARVCKRFQKVIQDGSLWKYIDLSHVQGNQSNKIRRFLQRYAGPATKYLRLGCIDHTIMEIVQSKCLHLQQLSLIMEASDTDLSLMPAEIVCLYMSFVKCLERDQSRNEFLRQGVKVSRFCEIPITPLEYVSIKGALIDDMLCEKLAQNKSLKQLRLDYSAVVACRDHQSSILGQVAMLEIHDCGFITNEAFTVTCEIVGRNKNLKGLELCDPSFSQPVPIGSVALDDLFRAIGNNCKLLMLSVDGPCFFTVSEDSLVHLIQNVHELKILSLVYNQDVSDRVLSSIPQELKNLTVLNLHGNREITNAGIVHLQNHPTLLALNLGACLKLHPSNILETAGTIPNLMLLGMSRLMEDTGSELSQFESDKPQVHIEFNYDIWLFHVQSITQSLTEYEMKHFIH